MDIWPGHWFARDGRHWNTLLHVALVAAGLSACEGVIGGAADSHTSSGVVGLVAGGGDAVASLLAVRVRRLSNSEFDATTHALLGTQQTFAGVFNADQRQGSYNGGGFPAAGFTRNAGAIFDAVSTPQIAAAADSLAAEAVTNNLSTLAPCTDANQTNCASTFITTFGAQAYRRPVTATELSGLLAVYQTGTTDQDYADGIELVITTILQSAGFLYLTELGGSVNGGVTTLTSYEIASALSYFITGAPPDAPLMKDAAADALQSPALVAQHATRLLGTPGAQHQVASFVEQWLGVDKPPGTSTGLQVTGTEMSTETGALIDDVMFNGDGSLSSLLTAPYTFVDGPLAQLYGVTAPASGTAKVQLGGQRIGLLNQASFLTTFAHSSFSAPVKRGHMVRTQMLCNQIPPPDPSLMVNTTPPLPTANETTRQAESAHETNPACAACHTLMDPIGFGFENFDGNGAYRTTENGQPIDSSGTVNSGGDATGAFPGGAALISQLAASTDVQQCYWSHFADFAAATTDPGIESTFLDFWKHLPAATSTNLPQVMVAFVQSDLFLKRSSQ
jgi:hypothetical protein